MKKGKNSGKVAKAEKQKERKESKAEVRKERREKFITKDMLIGDVARKYPETIEVMFKHGMHCIGCGMTAYESIEQGCMGHGLSEEEIDKMVEEMNKLLAKKAKA